jgi:hypothetical protein
MTEPTKEPELTDIGTRYEHMKDYADALEACAIILESRGSNSNEDRARLAKFKIAAELAQHTIDNFSGYKDARAEYGIHKLLQTIPSKADEVEGGRGTPLANDYKPWNDQD